jgi:hypothetical protein
MKSAIGKCYINMIAYAAIVVAVTLALMSGLEYLGAKYGLELLASSSIFVGLAGLVALVRGIVPRARELEALVSSK